MLAAGGFQPLLWRPPCANQSYRRRLFTVTPQNASWSNLLRITGSVSYWGWARSRMGMVPGRSAAGAPAGLATVQQVACRTTQNFHRDSRPHGGMGKLTALMGLTAVSHRYGRTLVKRTRREHCSRKAPADVEAVPTALVRPTLTRVKLVDRAGTRLMCRRLATAEIPRQRAGGSVP